MKKYISAACMLLVAGSCFAFDPDFAAIEDASVFARNPVSGIRTPEKANEVLAEVSKARARLADIAEFSTKRCNENFFVNSCIDDVRKARMRQEQKLLELEAAAKKVIRDDKARQEVQKQKERDAKAAQRQAEAKAKAQEAKPLREVKPAKTVDAEKKSSREKRLEELQKRAEHHRQMLDEAAENRAKYEAKLREREERIKKREQAIKEREAKAAKQGK